MNIVSTHPRRLKFQPTSGPTQECVVENQPLTEIRRLIGDHIDRLIAVLDDLDGDPDSEPSFGNLWEDSAYVARPYGWNDECEECPDAEPSLGWTSTYSTGTDDDREGDEHDGREWDH